jgi:hypothetical protein
MMLDALERFHQISLVCYCGESVHSVHSVHTVSTCEDSTL